MWKGIGLTILTVVVIGVLAVAFDLIDVGRERLTAPMREETRTQVYENSRMYVEGMRSELGDAYQEWVSTSDPTARMGIENFVKARFGDFPLDELNDLPILQGWLLDIRGY